MYLSSICLFLETGSYCVPMLSLQLLGPNDTPLQASQVEGQQP